MRHDSSPACAGPPSDIKGTLGRVASRDEASERKYTPLHSVPQPPRLPSPFRALREQSAPVVKALLIDGALNGLLDWDFVERAISTDPVLRAA